MTEKVANANADISVRQKISASLRAKWQEPAFRAEMMEKMSNRKGKQGAHDQSHREKISAAMRAKWQDEDYRAKAMEGIAKRQEELSKTRPLKPRSSPNSPVRASKARVPIMKAKGAAPADGGGGNELPSFSSFEPPIRGDGLQLVQPRTIPREPKKRKGRKKGTPNKPKPTVAKKAAVKVAPKKVVADGEKKATPSSGDTDEDGEADSGTGKTKGKKPNGSVDRLREERRDLYDLLYGDEDEAPKSSSAQSNVMANLPLGDDNLDEFDPYGLDDF
jgi:hypothetical protein